MTTIETYLESLKENLKENILVPKGDVEFIVWLNSDMKLKVPVCPHFLKF